MSNWALSFQGIHLEAAQVIPGINTSGLSSLAPMTPHGVHDGGWRAQGTSSNPRCSEPCSMITWREMLHCPSPTRLTQPWSLITDMAIGVNCYLAHGSEKVATGDLIKGGARTWLVISLFLVCGHPAPPAFIAAWIRQLEALV